MDKPLMTEGVSDSLIAGERAIERAFADAAFAMFGFGRPRRGIVSPSPFGGADVILPEVRRALIGARWGAEP